jgi:hypothetical protein
MWIEICTWKPINDFLIAGAKTGRSAAAVSPVPTESPEASIAIGRAKRRGGAKTERARSGCTHDKATQLD